MSGTTDELSFSLTLDGYELSFQTNARLFSPRRADPGTLALLRAAVPYLITGTKVLDLGCGCGLVGVYAAKLCGSELVVMSDILPEAVSMSAQNAAHNGLDPLPTIVLSDGFSDIPGKDYNLILSNPPYHTDFSVPKTFIEKGFNRLSIGGKFMMVTKRRDWYKNKLVSVFGGVKITEDDGYFIFEAEKKRLARGRNS